MSAFVPPVNELFWFCLLKAGEFRRLSGLRAQVDRKTGDAGFALGAIETGYQVIQVLC
jgi:hypothetical protein